MENVATEFAIGDRVRLRKVAVERKIYSRGALGRRGEIIRFGVGENTQHCAHIRWDGSRHEEFLHTFFLDRA